VWNLASGDIPFADFEIIAAEYNFTKLPIASPVNE
jgi:hypothetical protein